MRRPRIRASSGSWPRCACEDAWLFDSVRTHRYSSGRTLGLQGGAAAVLVIYGLTRIPPGIL
jgi:hypothetical protein